jgi:NADPH-dependent 2,4-dienoyl-CoA reductase/sulfur reductase-like enzyme/nitrite reductase/ring-hydroxylating ferredoxin subunit
MTNHTSAVWDWQLATGKLATDMDQPELTGPDLRLGVPLAQLEEGVPVLGHADGEAVLVVRRGEGVHAIGATCTHYGGPLAEGLVTGDTVVCPWHHACFSLLTGEAVGAPALNPVACWSVEVAGGTVRLTGKTDSGPLDDHGRSVDGPASVVIVGSGAAGSAAAEMLRREGYAGPITMIDGDEDAPYDRPNLSKDYLAGNAPEEWIPLRPGGFYEEHGVRRILGRATSIETERRTVHLSTGEEISYGTLLLATGATPVSLPIPGSDRPHVHYLRSLADSRAIVAGAEKAARAVVIGSSFIGMEVAASLRARGLAVDVISPESVPFERTLGPALGEGIRAVHERNGVTFHMGRTAAEIGERSVRLSDGTELEAGLVVVGIGVRPDLALAEAAGLRVDNGVLVDEYLETSAPGVFAAGDIARWPDAATRAPIRVEHWVVAQRQGQAAARNILGRREAFRDVPFFWTQQFDLGVNYVGHASGWESVATDGDLEARDFSVRYIRGGRTLALATIGRDAESLAAEQHIGRGEDLA